MSFVTTLNFGGKISVQLAIQQILFKGLIFQNRHLIRRSERHIRRLKLSVQLGVQRDVFEGLFEGLN